MRIAIIGRSEILYQTANILHEEGHHISCILTAKEAPEYSKTSKDFEFLAKKWNVLYSCSAKIDDQKEFLKKSNSDVGVSVNYSGVIPSNIINLFPLGILNAHGGDLPRYRGNACQAWAILNGEDKMGLCVHRMIGGELDNGDIIARDYLAIDVNTKIKNCWEWMVCRTPTLYLEAINELIKNPNYILERQSKNPDAALRCYPRLPEDGRINWSNSALQILRLINASNKPYAGAYGSYEDKKFIIWEAELSQDGENFCAIPGQITKVDSRYVEVACGCDKLRIFLVECEGRVAEPSHWIKSIRKRLS